METKVQIKELFSTLNFSDKLSIYEELGVLLETENGAIFFSEDFGEGENISSTEISNEYVNEKKDKPLREKVLDFFPAKPVLENCIECNSTKIIRWGTYHNEQRYKCKNCNRTFTANTSNIAHDIHKLEEFLDFGDCMFNGEFHSIDYLSKKFKVDTKTAFDWRHKYLSSVSTTEEAITFRGTVEMDDVWVELNEKGRKDKTDSRKRGGGTAGDNDKKVKVLFSVERAGESSLKVVRSGRLRKDDISRALRNDCFAPQAELCSDMHPSIVAFGKAKELKHKTFKASEHVKDKVIHVQTINSMASHLKKTINNKMRGVATKYLQNYANWFRIEQKFKDMPNKFRHIIENYMQNNKAWDHFSNAEAIYKRFIEKYSRLEYTEPEAKKRKSCEWNFQNIEELLI